MSHTKEPWAIFEDDAKAIVTVHHPMLSLMTVGDDGLATMFSEADARRIVACVNACRGISNADLEMGNSAFINVFNERSELKARCENLQRQRDELLAAAEAIEINADECMDFDECTAMLVPMDDWHKLIEAIASAKGGA